MKQVKLQKVGKFAKTHGVQGYLLLTIDSNISIDLLDKTILDEEWIFVSINGIPVPFFIVENGVKQHGDNAYLIKLDTIDANKAKDLCPSDVFVNIFYIKDSIHAKENYDSIVGFSIIDKKNASIAKVEYFIDIKENPLIAVNYNNEEVLIPIKSDYILNIDFDKEEIYTDFPSDYLETLM